MAWVDVEPGLWWAEHDEEQVRPGRGLGFWQAFQLPAGPVLEQQFTVDRHPHGPGWRRGTWRAREGDVTPAEIPRPHPHGQSL